jgi:hypothetical protein
MKLELLTEDLETKGLGTRGVDIFAHEMTADCIKGILLRNPLTGTPVDANLPGYYRSKLQAIVRCPTEVEGDALADRLGKALKMFNRSFLALDGTLLMKINHLYPAQLPIRYPRSPGQGIEWSLNFVTSYVQP